MQIRVHQAHRGVDPGCEQVCCMSTYSAAPVSLLQRSENNHAGWGAGKQKQAVDQFFHFASRGLVDGQNRVSVSPEGQAVCRFQQLEFPIDPVEHFETFAHRLISTPPAPSGSPSPSEAKTGISRYHCTSSGVRKDLSAHSEAKAMPTLINTATTMPPSAISVGECLGKTGVLGTWAIDTFKILCWSKASLMRASSLLRKYSKYCASKALAFLTRSSCLRLLSVSERSLCSD